MATVRYDPSKDAGLNMFPAEAAEEVGEHSPLNREGFFDDRTVLVQRTLRSGQSICYPGNVVIIGNVNPGAEVVAGGNIVVMGYLRGIAHAGASGNLGAVVVAFRLYPTQLRIAGHISRAPDGERARPSRPEIARIEDGVVIVEEYKAGSLFLAGKVVT